MESKFPDILALTECELVVIIYVVCLEPENPGASCVKMSSSDAISIRICWFYKRSFELNKKNIKTIIIIKIEVSYRPFVAFSSHTCRQQVFIRKINLQ